MTNLVKYSDPEAEKKIVVGLLKDRKKLDKAILKISTKEFSVSEYSNFFHICTQVHIRHNSFITATFLSDYLETCNVEQDKRLYYLNELTILSKLNVTDAEFDLAVKLVKNAFVARSVQDLLLDATNTLQQGGGKKAFNKLDKGIYDIKTVTSDVEYLKVADLNDPLVGERYLTFLADVRNNPDKYRGVPSGWKALDKVTNGFLKGEYALILGKSGSGKSMVMLNWANHARNAGYNVVYFSLEMPETIIMHRLTSLETGIPFFNIRNQSLTVEEVNLIEKTVREWPTKSGTFKIFDLPKCTAGTLEAHIRQYQQKVPVDIVFVDYMAFLKPEAYARGNKSWEIAAEISNNLRELARTLNVAVVTAHQVTGDGMKKTGQDDLQLEDIAVSKRIPDPADLVVGIIRDPNNMNDFRISVPKCRNGAIPSTSMWCNLDICKMTDAQEQRDDQLKPPDLQSIPKTSDLEEL